MSELVSSYLWLFFTVTAIAGVLRMVMGFRMGRPGKGRQEDDEPTAGELPPDDQRPRVLIVDDSAVVLAKLEKLLHGAGFAVEKGRNGAEGLARLGVRRFDLLITDIEMPEMDGFELIRWVKNSLETEDLPIIAITGNEELHAKIHQCAGINGFFAKPWNDRDLLRQVRFLTRLSAGGRSGGQGGRDVAPGMTLSGQK